MKLIFNKIDEQYQIFSFTDFVGHIYYSEEKEYWVYVPRQDEVFELDSEELGQIEDKLDSLRKLDKFKKTIEEFVLRGPE
jgi:hypothetical protein